MLRASRGAIIRRMLVSISLQLLLPACGESAREHETAAGLHGRIETALRRIETGKLVDGLRYRDVTVDPDPAADGFTVKITDMKLGDPQVGFQSFSQMTFIVARTDATHFLAGQFRFTPEPVGQGPLAASQTLVELLWRTASTPHDADD